MASAVKSPNLRHEQAEQTRTRILGAAEQLFARRGFTAARIEDVAAESGVAVPTVYKVFSNKRTLLVAVLTLAMGGEVGARVDDQAWWVEQLEEPNPGHQLALVARNARRIYERAAPLLEALRAAAPLDAELADTWERLSSERLDRSRRTAERLVAKAAGHARFDVETTALTLWSLTAAELYTAHVRMRRSPAQYEAWLADVLRSALLAPT